MRSLKSNERDFLNNLLEYKPILKNGYYHFVYKKKSYKRSRVFIQLHINKKLELWEVIHHKDKIKTNDSINNLEVLQTEEHTSQHHAGLKKPR